MASSPQPSSALPPPPGEASNFVNPESLSKSIILCVTLCLSVTGIALILRTYVRIFIKRVWILEDCKFPSAVPVVCPLTFCRYVLHILGERDLKSITEVHSDLNKAGLVIFCGLLITLMYKHGGVHEWDLTSAQVRTVLYVRTGLLIEKFGVANSLRSGLMSEQ